MGVSPKPRSQTAPDPPIVVTGVGLVTAFVPESLVPAYAVRAPEGAATLGVRPEYVTLAVPKHLRDKSSKRAANQHATTANAGFCRRRSERCTHAPAMHWAPPMQSTAALTQGNAHFWYWTLQRASPQPESF